MIDTLPQRLRAFGFERRAFNRLAAAVALACVASGAARVLASHITELTVPVTVGTKTLGEIRLHVGTHDFNATGNEGVGKATVAGEQSGFYPANGMTLDKMAWMAGEDHFNWLQIVTQQPPGHNATFGAVPHPDPSADPDNPISRDKLPWILNEGPNGTPPNPAANPPFDLPAGSSTSLPYQDFPSGFSEGEMIAFDTYLVSIIDNTAKTFDVHAAFSWKITYEKIGMEATPRAHVTKLDQIANPTLSQTYKDLVKNYENSGFKPGVPPKTEVWDTIVNNSSDDITWGEGHWTQDGHVLGSTFEGGFSQLPGTETSDHKTLYGRPNDFHFDAERLEDNSTYDFWSVWDDGSDFEFTYELFTIPGVTNYLLDFDFVNESLFVGDQAADMSNELEPVIYDGSIFEFDPSDFGGFFTGDYRNFGSFFVPTPINGLLQLSTYGETYTEDFNTLLGLGGVLPTGWAATTGPNVHPTITQAFPPLNVAAGTYDAGDAADRTLATGNTNRFAPNTIQLWSELVGPNDVLAVVLETRVEAWYGDPAADVPGEAAFYISLEFDPEKDGFFNTAEVFNNGNAVTTGFNSLSPGALDGNGSAGTSFTSGLVVLPIPIPAGSDIRLTFDAQDVDQTQGYIFGVDDVLLRIVAPGDTDGNGVVDSTDLFAILGAGKFNHSELGPATWGEGDFTGDTLVNSDDLFAMLSAAKFNAGPYTTATPPAALATVPEPSSFVLAAFGLVTLVMIGRRHRFTDLAKPRQTG